MTFFNASNTKMLKFLVVQDIKRAETLMKYFNFAGRVFILPNSYIGCTNEVSTFAHERFNIPINKKILLYTGAIERWSYDIDLAKYLGKLLDKDYILLLSGFCRDNYVDTVAEEYSDLIKERKVVINTEIFNESDYTELVKSATIGLVWYRKLDASLYTSVEIENIYLMGLSSGKLCKYLSCSIPVVAPSFYIGYEEFIEGKKVGKVSDYGKEIVDKILMISSDYDFYKHNVEMVYKNELEYSNQCQSVMDEIEKIVS
jgi:glycosyltransferase involved in cell wall biosynthesis